MSIGDAIGSFLAESRISHKELANELHVDRSFVTKIIGGERKWPEAQDSKLAAVSWKLALKLADERTGGYFSNVLEDVPNLDLHPAALKDLLLKELNEAYLSLGELQMAKHIDPVKRKQAAERVWNEITDVMEIGAILRGVMEEEFGLDRKSMILKHELQVKKGER